MGTKFTGHKTGFNRSGSNDVVPNTDGQTTTFVRGSTTGLPGGKLKVSGSIAADTAGANRRIAKVKNNNGGGTPQRGTNAFSKPAKSGK